MFKVNTQLLNEAFVLFWYFLHNDSLEYKQSTLNTGFLISSHTFSFFLAFDFCRFCVVTRFFHPSHNGQWPPTSKDILSQILSITFIFLEEPLFPFLMLSAKQGNYLVPFVKRLWYDAVLDWGLNPGPPTLDASTLTTRLSRRRYWFHLIR